MGSSGAGIVPLRLSKKHLQEVGMQGRGIAPSFFNPQAATRAHIAMQFEKDDLSSFSSMSTLSTRRLTFLRLADSLDKSAKGCYNKRSKFGRGEPDEGLCIFLSEIRRGALF
jgi:hypothetical protein